MLTAPLLYLYRISLQYLIFQYTVALVNPTCSKMNYAHTFGTETCEQECIPNDRVKPIHPKCPEIPLSLLVKDRDTGEPVPNARVNVTDVDLDNELVFFSGGTKVAVS